MDKLYKKYCKYKSLCSKCGKIIYWHNKGNHKCCKQLLKITNNY